MTDASRPAWHLGDWGPLGLLETLIKAIAFIAAYAALAEGWGGSFGLPSGAGLAQLALLGVAELGLLAAIGDRLVEREISAMMFVVFNNLAHLAMIGALLFDPGPEGLLVAFATLMAAGDMVKLGWLASSGFTVREVPPALVQGLTAAYVAVYLAVLVLELF